MNINLIKIKKMDIDDVNILTNTFSEFDDFWNSNIFKSDFEQNNSYYIVAKSQEGEIIGFAGMKIFINEADIMNIATKKIYRNIRIGSLILKNLLEIAKNLGLSTITLEVNEKNNIAIKLYKKFNFEIIGKRKKYYNNQFDAIIMQKKLITNRQ